MRTPPCCPLHTPSPSLPAFLNRGEEREPRGILSRSAESPRCRISSGARARIRFARGLRSPINLVNLKDYFVYKEVQMDPMEYSDDTVAFTNVPFYTATCEIDKLLEDCGEVIGIQAERVRNPQNGKKCQVVFVTFEDPAAAKRALLKESLMVDENLIEVTAP